MSCKRIFFIRSNAVNPDPRVEKQAGALLRNGYKVSIVGWDRMGESKSDNILVNGLNVPIHLYKRKASFGGGIKNIFSLIAFQFYILITLYSNRKVIGAVQAADFDTVIPSFLFCKLMKIPIVYDVYDFYVDSFPVPERLKPAVKYLDLHIMSKVNSVILVNETRKKQIEGAVPRKLVYIHNTPDDISEKVNYSCNTERKVKSIKSNSYSLVLSYVGILQPTRMLEDILELFSTHPDWKLEIAGFGALEEKVKYYAKLYPNITFHGKVNYAKGIEISNSSDLLFATYDPSVPNHKFSSPNKVYEAMMLGKGIVVCNGTGMDFVVEDGFGIAINYTIVEFESLLERLADEHDKLREFGEKARAQYELKYSWRIMELRLLSLYSELGI